MFRGHIYLGNESVVSRAEAKQEFRGRWRPSFSAYKFTRTRRLMKE
jgi:hypothetical protein